MGWTPLFLEMKDKNVLIAGAGEVGMRRARRFLEAEANVTIIAGTVPEELIHLGANLKPVSEVEEWVGWADLVVVATGDPNLNQHIADLAGDKLLNRADDPHKGNLIVPSYFFIGDVQICIFTNFKSPLMARELRKKIEKVINNEDILQIELQDYTRKILKERINDQKKRKSYLYQILKDEKVGKLLNEGHLEEAKKYVEDLVKNL
jgi:precorrin-2 dehydrogenase / sirohydrochlorin ferrochelatase